MRDREEGEKGGGERKGGKRKREGIRIGRGTGTGKEKGKGGAGLGRWVWPEKTGSEQYDSSLPEPATGWPKPAPSHSPSPLV